MISDYDPNDTIVAIATASGGAARAILRLAGPDVIACLEDCFRFEASWTTELRDVRSARVIAGTLILDGLGRRLPCDLYLWPDARSYTRGPLAELHTIGSPPLVEAALRTVCRYGARLAQPGEFTLRAFLGGRIDLAQAEAVLGVIDATSDRELHVALRQMAGGLMQPLKQIRDDLLDLLAHLEAGLDFVEEDIEFITPDELDRQIGLALDQLTRLIEQIQSRTESAQAVRVVLIGSVNVGKSSLFNALSGQPHALVSSTSGTTRDYLTTTLDLDGLPCELIDTAGVERAGDDAIADAAQIAGDSQHRQARLQLFCLDNTRPPTDWEQEQLAEGDPDSRIIVMTKCDDVKRSKRDAKFVTDAPTIRTSSRTGLGLADLRSAMRERAMAQPTESDVIGVTAARCRDSLDRAAELLCLARDQARHSAGEELVAAELRGALDELGQVLGTVYTDDILDRVFRQFCIGK